MYKRQILYRKGKAVEILECYEPDFTLMNEWYKQLFGESEGKDQKLSLIHIWNLTMPCASPAQVSYVH